MAAKGTVLYKPVGMLLGMAAGMVAGMAFQRLWKTVAGETEAPQPMDRDGLWREILPAAALQGATFAVVRAAVERGGAIAVHRATGRWPE
ncbi:DUF4235 domain-containing protein [Streptomyces enissocaesilis]|uniref:DUF4235 domain-containing protein n=1 Tax=Streptomyces enissocaesilis TaxID=332589 RepID=UPI0031D3E8CA